MPRCRALESVFVSVVAALESEMVFTRHLVGGLLAELEDDIDRDKFKRLLHYSRRLGNFQNRVKLVGRLTFSPPRKPQKPLIEGERRPSLHPHPAFSTVPGSPHATYLIHYLPLSDFPI